MKWEMSKEWYERMSKLEEGLEIGGGSTINPTPAEMVRYSMLAWAALPQWAKDDISDLLEKTKTYEDALSSIAEYPSRSREDDGENVRSMVNIATKALRGSEQGA